MATEKVPGAQSALIDEVLRAYAHEPADNQPLVAFLTKHPDSRAGSWTRARC